MRRGTKNDKTLPNDFVDRALQCPQTVFRRPRDVVDDPRLTLVQKSDALANWAYDACELDVAEEEGMGGGVPSESYAVISALNLLTQGNVSEYSSPTKHAAPFFR